MSWAGSSRAARGPSRAGNGAAEVIADTYLSVSTPVSMPAPALLRVRAECRSRSLARTRQNLKTLIESTTGTACRTLHAEGGWYGTVQTPFIRTAEEWTLRCWIAAMCWFSPGIFYDFEPGSDACVQSADRARRV